MEKLIRGDSVKRKKAASGKTFAEFSIMVRKGHSDCGDSGFLCSDEDKVIVGVFDGVSGAPGADQASSDAAEAALHHLKKLKKAKDKDMKDAFSAAHLAINVGSTTGAVLFLSKDGSFIVASIGDSPIYGIDKSGNLELELPLARAVKAGDAIFKFLSFRNLLNSAMGGPSEYLDISIRSGKMRKGEMFLLASDGLMDNLFLEVKDGYVTESSGKADLKALISKKDPVPIVKLLMETVEKRIKVGKVEKKGAILHPKDDDITIAAVKLL